MRFRVGRRGGERWTRPLEAGAAVRVVRRRARRLGTSSVALRLRGSDRWGRPRPLSEGLERLRTRLERASVGQVWWVRLDDGPAVLAVRCVAPAAHVAETVGNSKIDRIYGEVTARWQVESWGICNRRYIDGTRTWCLGPETPVLTPEGWFPIAELPDEVMVLTSSRPGTDLPGRWTRAQIRRFGESRLLEVHLVRAGSRRTLLRATPDHRWFLAGGEVRRTDELKPGDRLASTRPMHLPRTRPSRIGVMHGIVFGDGSMHRDATTSAFVTLHGPKKELVGYFEGLPVTTRVNEEWADPVALVVSGLPRSWRSLPGLDESVSYLMGFLAGWIATDGYVSQQGQITLSSRSPEALEAARVIALRCGIATNPLVTKKSVGFGEEVREGFEVGFVRDRLPEHLLIRRDHRQRFASTPTAPPQPWTVEGIEDTGATDEVWCAVVPGTEAFVVGEWILTHNSQHAPWPAPDPGSNAWDIHASPRRMRKIALALAERAGEWGVGRVIYAGRVWDRERGWHDSPGIGHYDHIHVEGWPERRGTPRSSCP